MLSEASNILVVELNFTQPNWQPCTDREGAAERGSAGPPPAVAHLLGRLHAPDQAGHHDQQLQGGARGAHGEPEGGQEPAGHVRRPGKKQFSRHFGFRMRFPYKFWRISGIIPLTTGKLDSSQNSKRH